MGALRVLLHCVWVMGCVAALFGCGRQSHHMFPLDKPAVIEAPANRAAVVFVNPQLPGSAGSAVILDERGGFLGTTRPGTHFAVLMTPGEHILVAWADDVRALRANLVAGRVYFIHAEAEMDPARNVVSLWPVMPNSPRWQWIAQWLAQTRAYVPDIPRGQADIDGRAAGVRGALDRARSALQSADANTLAERTLAPEYGIAAVVRAGAPIPMPTPLPGAAPVAASPPPAPEPAEPPATHLGPLQFAKLRVVGTDEQSQAELKVIEEGTTTTERGISIGFRSDENNFGETLGGYTYDPAGIDQLAQGDAVLLFVPGLEYREISMPSGAEYEDQDGNLIYAPEDWGGSHLNGAWVLARIDQLEKKSEGLRLRLESRVRSTSGSLHKNLYLMTGENGYTVKPLVNGPAKAYPLKSVSPEQAQRKVGILTLTGDAFSAKGDSACDTDVMITGATGEELQTDGHVGVVGGEPTLFCPGARHKWLGTVEYGGFKVRSNRDDPLRFSVDANKGYVLAGGRGSITFPSGSQVTIR